MILISDKCHSYDEEIKKIRNMIAMKKFIFTFPTVFLVLLSVVLSIVCKTAAFLTINILVIIYVVALRVALPPTFSNLCKNAVKKYFEFYGISESTATMLDKIATRNYVYNSQAYPNLPLCMLMGDNKGYIDLIGHNNSLFVWTNGQSLRFISVVPITINKFKYFGTSKYEIDNRVSADFGSLIIPIEQIDHYRENTMVCDFGENSLCKFSFSDSQMLDILIPKKDFYYQSKKKND